MTWKRAACGVSLAIIAVFGAMLLLPPRTGFALWHNEYPDMVSACDECHTLTQVLAEPGTSLIRAGIRSLPTMKAKNANVPPAAFGCTFCHYNTGRSTYMRDALEHFSGKSSQHPVDRGYVLDTSRNVTLTPNTNTTRWLSNWDNSFTEPADQIGCVHCHDVNNTLYTSTTGVPGGYPNHISSDNAVRVANPFMLRGGASSWSAADNAATNAFCLSICHAGTAPGTAGYRMGHYAWGAYDNAVFPPFTTLGQLKEHHYSPPTPMLTSKCVDCHESHYSSAKQNLMGERNEPARISVSQALASVDPANCTNICHSPTLFNGSGHGKAGVNQFCSSCHNSAVSHRTPANSRRFGLPEVAGPATLAVNLSGNGLDDDLNGVIDDAGEVSMQYSAVSVCKACHSNKNIHQGAIAGNSTTSGRTAGCLHCHEPHGNGTDNNLFMVRRNLLPGNKTINYWAAGADYWRNDGNSVCDNFACHGRSLGNTSTPGTIMYDVADHRNTPGMGPGYNCAECHSHSSTTGAASFSAQCNACHTYPGQDVLPGTHVLSAVHGIHVDPDPAGYGFSCGLCHYQNNHNQAGLADPAQWGTLVTAASVNIRFDPSWNPLNANGPRYNGVAADNGSVPAPGTTPAGTGTCAGLYCHGNSVSALVWSGSTTTPKWDNVASGNCGTCHRATASVAPQTFAHAKHADSATGYGIGCSKCHFATTADNVTIASKAEHLNRQTRVTYPTGDPLLGSGTYNGNPATVGTADGTMACGNIYCHSPGTRFTANFDNGALGAPNWNQGALACNACHGSAANTTGSPVYPNGSPKINSHASHVALGYGCQACHVNVTTTGTTISAAGRPNHVNGAYTVNPDNVSHNFTTPYVSPNCANIACHGGNPAAWGGAPPKCGQCHLAASDTDQYQTASNTWFANDNTATIDNTEWLFSGHGKTSGTYPVSGHNAADFTNGAGAGGDPCTYCHDAGVLHRVPTNPFRLKDQTGVPAYATAGWNATCLVCHSLTQAPPGYTPPGASFARPTSPTDRVDAAHYGVDHVADNTLGGRLCWDCHDTHGDSPNPSGNIYMIQKRTLRKTDGVYGYQGAAGIQTGAIVFTNDNAPISGGQWADNVAPYDGICNVCHTTALHYRTNSGDTHNRDKKCTDCHDHDKNFAASCNACHGEPTGVGVNGMPPFAPTSGNPWASAGTVDNLSNLPGVGSHRTATGISYSAHEVFSCNECHTTNSGSDAAHNTGKANASMSQISTHNWYIAGFNASWSPGPLAGAVAGGSVTDDSCGNINCHSPYFGTPANQYRSGTPTPYTRYWLNVTRFDCYTCHAYDGRTATSRPATGNRADNTMSTGPHDVHVDNNAMACSRCHDVTGYSATTWPNANANHKNGGINVSFNGAPDPWAAAHGYSIPDNTVPSDDNAAAVPAHRSWGSCSNVYCHSIGQDNAGLQLTSGNAAHYRTPAWDNALSGRCGTCHGGDGVTENPGNYIASASHTQHVNAASPPYRYVCNACHTGLGRNQATHADNAVNLNFGYTFPIYGTAATATYSQGNNHLVGNGFGTCTNTYCHGTDPNPALRLSNGANQATTNPNVPRWGTLSTGNCGSCHGAPGATTNFPTASPIANWPGGSHARHMAAANDNAGPYIDTCDRCHTAYALVTHGNGRVDLKTAFNDNTATDKAGTRVCDPCHGSAAGIASAKANWDTVAALDCLTCHGSSRATAGADNTGTVAPNVAGDNATYGAAILGHNRTTAQGPYPGSSNPAANRLCGECHNLASRHIDNVAGATFATQRLLATVNGIPGVDNVTKLCAACHTQAGTSPATKKRVNRHGNAGYAGRLEAVFPELECSQCHEAHGRVNVAAAPAGVNIWMINPTITVRPGTTVSPVRLYAKTGANSFNNYDPGAGNELNAALYTANANDQLCVVCHANTLDTGFPMARNISGRHNAPAYTGDETGKDCSGCHSHNQDDNLVTVDGLMPLACNACHSYPGVLGGTFQRAMSVVHATHVGTPADTLNSRQYECTICHFNYNHNQAGVVPGGAWTAYNPATHLNIDFDNTLNKRNANGPRYNGVATPTFGNGGTGACAGIYCHGNSGADTFGNGAVNQSTWGGTTTATPPQWDNVPTAACGSCHNASTAMPQGNHPAHLAAAFGPPSTQFTAGGTCSEGTGCHTAYGFSPTTTHANGQPSFRTSTGNSTPVGVGATQICQNCHSTFTSVNTPTSGDNLVRLRANWDNTTYKVSCVTCHNNSAGGTLLATQNLDGSGNKAPNIEAAYYTSGHGAAGVPPTGIDNSSTTTDSGTVDQVPPVRCQTCHDELGAHIGTLKDGVNPWRLDNALTRFAIAGGLDNSCLNQCHTAAAQAPARHAWRVNSSAPFTPQTKDNTVHTHPTSVNSVPTTPIDKSRWMLVTTDGIMPLLDNLSTKSPPARTGTTQVVCVTCHDPHGVTNAPIATRSFSGTNDNNGYQMLRYKNGAQWTTLCAKCHK